VAATLAGKLLLKPGRRAAVVAAPAGYRLDGAEGVELVEPAAGDLDFAQVFVNSRAELDTVLAPVLPALKPEALLWVCYRKGGAKAGSDLNRDQLWAEMGERGWTGVTLVAVDGAWSAMRFRRAG